MVGLYETALDELCAREVDGKTVRPKIVASTATVRRAEDQIQALFDRRDVDVFPPPGPDRRDSFFAATVTADREPRRGSTSASPRRAGARRSSCCGRTSRCWARPQKAYRDAGGARRTTDNPADPYMTLLGYFNSLRELGGSRRIVEDEVSTPAHRLRRRASGSARTTGSFADRKIVYEVVELTSRVQHRQGGRGQAAARAAVPREGARRRAPSPPT